jgi:FixJ family two-component response regulator
MDRNNADERQQIVVVIDDDPAVLGALRFALELEGFAVDAYRDGTEVLRQKDLPGSGCLVIDFNLPDMNGLDLLAELRRRNVALPAILITTNPTSILRERAAAFGMKIVEKPLLGDALVDAIRRSLNAAGALPA